MEVVVAEMKTLNRRVLELRWDWASKLVVVQLPVLGLDLSQEQEKENPPNRHPYKEYRALSKAN